MPGQNTDRDYLSTAQAARRLGVKPETIYAYVSRGVLRSNRLAGRRGSYFAVEEVERLAGRPGAAQDGSGSIERIRTRITLLDRDELYYRGRLATALADRPFEQVAHFLWTGDLPDAVEAATDPSAVVRSRSALAALPPRTRLVDRLRLIVTVAAAADPLRSDLGAGSVIRTTSRLIGTVADALAAEPVPDAPFARRLWPALTPDAPTTVRLRVLNAALVLLADHDLAASTLAARVAASARADPYAVIAAGLGALDGPFHGAATVATHRFVAELLDDPVDGLARRFRSDLPIPGFGHMLYTGRDPRADHLLALLRELDDAHAVEVLALADQVIAELAERRGHFPNSDFALGVLAHALRLHEDAPAAIFGVARIAGWIAHALEEYQEPPLRFRIPGVYTGVRPG